MGDGCGGIVGELCGEVFCGIFVVYGVFCLWGVFLVFDFICGGCVVDCLLVGLMCFCWVSGLLV